MKIAIDNKIGVRERNVRIEIDENGQNFKTILNETLETLEVIEHVQGPKERPEIKLTVDGKEIARALMPKCNA